MQLETKQNKTKQNRINHTMTTISSTAILWRPNGIITNTRALCFGRIRRLPSHKYQYSFLIRIPAINKNVNGHHSSFFSTTAGGRSLRSLRRQRRLIANQKKNQKVEAAASPPSQSLQHQPPLPVRIALVSATTAVATPAFPAIGFVNLVLRLALSNTETRSLLSASIGSVLSFATWTLVPAFYNLAPVILPCAIGNGLVAGASFGVLDAIANRSTQIKYYLYHNPLGAGAIGAVTGFVAPYFVYGPLFQAMYGLEGMTESTRMILAYPMATQITMATGLVAGWAMFPVLYFPMNGITGASWKYFSAPALLGISLALLYVYTPNEGMTVPDGTYIEPQDVALLDSIVRYNVSREKSQAFSLSSGQWVVGPVECVQTGRELLSQLEITRNQNYSYWQDDNTTITTFDDRLIAWLDSYTWLDGASNYPNHVVSIPNRKKLESKQQILLETDAVVAYIVQRAKQNEKTMTQTQLLEAIEKMDELNPKNKKAKSGKVLLQQLQSMEALSVAVELLLLLRQQQQQQDDETKDHMERTIQECEQFIHLHNNKTPIVLYAKDEEVDPYLKGVSVESQLQALGWNIKDRDVEELLPMWQEVYQEHEDQRWRDLAIQGAGVVLLSSLMAASLLLARN